MRDDQKRALLADGGKGEAVYQYKVRDLSGWHDCDAGAYERITTNMPEHVEARTLFTAPTPERAQESYWQKAAETLERANVELSCAYVELKKKLRAQESAGVLNIPLDAAATMADYAPQAECAPRGDAEKDVTLTNEDLEKLFFWVLNRSSDASLLKFKEFARAILAANKEKT